MILVEGAGQVLPPMGPRLGAKTQQRLEKLGVEVRVNSMVTNVDYMGVTLKDKNGIESRVECACKVWSAGVQASPLGKILADQSDGTEVDRAGRVIVEPDLSIKGHPNVFVVGDMAVATDTRSGEELGVLLARLIREQTGEDARITI